MEIQRGIIDIGVVINPAEVPDLVIQKLAEDMVYVWSSSKKNKAAVDTIICDQNLFQTQYILRKWKNKPKKVLHTDSLDLIVRLVQEGLGLGIIPERATQIHKANLTKCEDLPCYKDKICLVYRPEFGKVPPERLTLEALKAGFEL
jgi:DNA-binding transcriptional LysR family regulator